MSWDYTLSDFITDGDWHTLTLAVPSTTEAVLLRIRMKNTKVGSKIIFKEAGNTNGINVAAVKIQAGTTQTDTERTAFLNSDFQLEYLITDNPTWTQLDVCIRATLT